MAPPRRRLGQRFFHFISAGSQVSLVTEETIGWCVRHVQGILRRRGLSVGLVATIENIPGKLLARALGGKSVTWNGVFAVVPTPCQCLQQSYVTDLTGTARGELRRLKAV
jgi:hypothetical protein